jgi:hypothetical protein
VPLALKAGVGNVTLVFQRKGVTKNGQTVVAIKFQVIVALPIGRRSLMVKTTLTGRDVLVGSLLYPVVFLGNGQNAPTVLQSLGYAVSLAGTPPTQTCEEFAARPECVLHAARLERLLDATLVASGDPESALFETGIQALGVAAFGVTTTTTTPSTTSTTLCPTGQTDCAGTCVGLMTDSNNCGSCGNICPSTTPSCVGGVCTIL